MSRIFSRINQQRKGFIRNLRIKFLQKNTSPKPLQSIDYDSICFLLMDHGIGDAIVLSGFIKQLRDKSKKVIICTNDKTQIIFKNLIPVDELHILKYGKDRKTAEVKQAITQVSKSQPDIIIDFNFYDDMAKLQRSQIIAAIKPKHAIGFNAIQPSLINTSIPTEKDEHVTQRITKIMSLLGLNTDNYNYHIEFNKNKVVDALNYLQKIKSQNKKLIIFNPNAGEKSRSLSKTQVTQLCDYLDTLQDTISIVMNFVDIKYSKLYSNVISNPFKDIENAFYLIYLSDLLISVDTSTVHLAAAFDKQQICIYNNKQTKTNNANLVWAPLSKNAKVMFTTEHIGISQGDNVHNFDMQLVVSYLNEIEI